MWSFQPEILDYLKGVADKYGLRRYIRFGAHVDRAHWDDDRVPLARLHQGRPGVRRAVPDLRRRRAAHPVHPGDPTGWPTSGGRPSTPRSGTTTVDLTGKRVAVIGTGASAIQIVPEIVGAGRRSCSSTSAPRPGCCRGRNNAIPPGLRDALRHRARAPARCCARHLLVPGGARLRDDPAARLLPIGEMAGKWNIRRQVRDRELRAPDRPEVPGRLQASPVLRQLLPWPSPNPSPELVTDRIARITPHGIVTADEHGRRPRDRRHRVRHRLPRHRLLHLRRHQGPRR